MFIHLKFFETPLMDKIKRWSSHHRRRHYRRSRSTVEKKGERRKRQNVSQGNTKMIKDAEKGRVYRPFVVQGRFIKTMA